MVTGTSQTIDIRHVSELTTIVHQIDFPNPVHFLNRSADSSEIIAISDGSVSMLDLNTGELTGTLFSRSNISTHPSTDIHEVGPMTIDRALSHIIAGYFQTVIVWHWEQKRSYFLKVLVWDLNTKTLRSTITHKETCHVLSVALDVKGHRCLLGLSNGTTELWDVATSSLLTTLYESDDDDDPRGIGEISVAFHPEGRLALTSSNKGGNSWTGQNIVISRGADRWVLRDRKNVRLQHCDYDCSRSSTHVFRHGSWVCAVAMSENEKKVASADWEGGVKVWDISKKQSFFGKSDKETPIATVDGWVTKGVRELRLSPTGLVLVWTSSDGTVKMWDVEAGKLSWMFELTLEGEAVGSTGDGMWVVFGVLPTEETNK
ncbi:hypothetical protein HK097_004502, partial [Rhizophlyctis rosea]